jgi:hypothetical protein
LKTQVKILNCKDRKLYEASIGISRAGVEVSIGDLPEALIGKLELHEEAHRRGKHIYRLVASDGPDNTYAVELCSHARFPRDETEGIGQALVFAASRATAR